MCAYRINLADMYKHSQTKKFASFITSSDGRDEMCTKNNTEIVPSFREVYAER